MGVRKRVYEIVEVAANGDRPDRAFDIAGGLQKIRRWRTVLILMIVVLTLAGGGLVVWNMNRPPNWPEITDELVLHWLDKGDTRLPDFKKLDWDDRVRDPYLRILCLAGDFKRVERRVADYPDYPARHKDSAWRTAAYSFYNASHYGQAAEAVGRIEDESRRSGTIERLTEGRYTGAWYIGTRPSKKRVQRIFAAISEMTSRRWLWKDAHEQVGELNLMLRGWANYFSLGPVSKAYRAVDAHVRQRLPRWLRSKHKIDSAGWSRYPDRYLYKTLGLVELSLLTRRLPWATA